MKKILALFILLAIFKTTIAQTNDTAKYNPKTYGYGWVYNRIKLDSGIIIPRIGDTTSKTKGQLRILGNNLCWVGNDGKWYVAGSGGNTYTAGYGLNLNSFAFSVDTNLITTKAWLYKVADSLAALITTPGIDDVLAQAQSLTTDRSIVTGLNNKFSILNTSDLGVSNYEHGGVFGDIRWKVKSSGFASDSLEMTFTPDGNAWNISSVSNNQDINSQFAAQPNGFYLQSNLISDASQQVKFSMQDVTAKFTDNRTAAAGIEYNADYSSTYTSRSLVDKAYVLANRGYTSADTGRAPTQIATGGGLLKVADSLGAIKVPYTGATGNLDLGTNSYLGASYSAYNTSDHTTNYERGRLYYNSNVLTLASEAAGTGVVRNMRIDAGTGSITFNAPGTYNFLNSAATTTFSGTAQALSYLSNATTGNGLQFITTGAEITNVVNFSSRAGGTTINGSNLLLGAQGASSGGTNLDGGDIQIKSGTSTGNAQSKIQFSTPDISGSGTTDNAPVLRAEINKDGLYVKTITDGTAGTDSLLVESGGTVKKITPIYTKTHYGTSFATSNTLALSTTNYLAIQASGSANVTENNRLWVVPETGTLRNLYVGISGTQSATGSLVFTIRQGTVGSMSDTGFTLTIPAGSTAGVYSNTGSTLSVTAGDVLSYKVVNNATATSAPIVVTAIIMTN